MPEITTSQRMALIRARHADYPCSLQPENTECFLLSQADNAWSIVAELRGQLSVVKDEHEELVAARSTISRLERQAANFESQRNEFREEGLRFHQEQETLIAAFQQVERIVSEALSSTDI